MKYLNAFFAFLWDFIIGDDWKIALGVVIALVLAALLAHNGINAWWAVPAIAVLAVTVSLRQTVRMPS